MTFARVNFILDNVKKILKHLRSQISHYTTISHYNQTSAIEKLNPIPETENAAYLTQVAF